MGLSESTRVKTTQTKMALISRIDDPVPSVMFVLDFEILFLPLYYFPPCCNETFDKSNLRKRGQNSGSQIQGMVHLAWKA